MGIKTVARPSGKSNGKSVISETCPFCDEEIGREGKLSSHIRHSCPVVEERYR